MGARPRSWLQTARKHPLVLGLIVLVVLSVLIFLGYRLDWHWTGFFHKTLWDWLNLLAALAIPVVAGFGVAWFTQLQQQRDKRLEQTQHEQDQKLAVQHAETEREIAVDNQREAALQAYIDNMSELLLKEGLRKSQSEDEVRKIARVHTLTVLPRLDATRKRSVLQFLHESGLIDKDTRIISLKGADLREASLYVADRSGTSLWITDLSEADLREANLYRANLSYAKLRGANLSETDLSSAHLNSADLCEVFLNEANLRDADLSEADLSNANLGGADLTGAKVAEEQLKKARSLVGATMPDGSIHP